MDPWISCYGERNDKKLLSLEGSDQRILIAEINLNVFDALWQGTFSFGAS
jgi:hypothetical protein